MLTLSIHINYYTIIFCQFETYKNMFTIQTVLVISQGWLCLKQKYFFFYLCVIIYQCEYRT